MNYSEKLKDPRWQKKRLKILERDDWACVKCGDKTSTLIINHLKYEGEPWEVEDKHLETLCEKCNLFYTAGQLIEKCKDKGIDFELKYMWRIFYPEEKDRSNKNALKLIELTSSKEGKKAIVSYLKSIGVKA